MAQGTLEDRLIAAIIDKGTPACVGLDPVLSKIPKHIKDEAGNDAGEAIFLFNSRLIDAVAPLVPVVKPQAAFYEAHGMAGMRAFERTLAHARLRGLFPITDAKRNDIGNTAE